MKNKLKLWLPYLVWSQALAATIGSLYFSEVLQYPPCTLCWYQRIAMYPLVSIIATGIIKKDKNLPLYVLPLSIIGMIVALYHTLLQAGIVREVITCAIGVPCTTRFINWFGFIDIPFLSFIAFAFITLSMVLLTKIYKK